MKKGENKKEVPAENLSAWAILSSEAVLKKAKVDSDGIKDVEAHRRLRQYGYNISEKEEKLGVVKELLSKFKSPLIILLIFAAVVEAYFGELVNAWIITVMVFLSAVLDFVEEHNAGKAAKKLLEQVRSTAVVRRGGKEKEIDSSSVTIGDILILNSGDLVPADARIIKANDFFVNQSSLTGESQHCEKTSEKISSGEKSLPEYINFVFSGTNVVSGSAEAVVVRTGSNTEFGKIAKTLIRPAAKSEFEMGITGFGILVMKVMFVLVLFIFLFNSVVERKVLESFLFAVAIAVGVTPELLPMIMSITMARGAISMSKKGAIVKKLSAIPNFGGLDILCTDKTGTLTEGKIALVSNVDLFGNTSDEVLKLAYFNSYFQTGIENPLDEAVLNYRDICVEQAKKIDEIPFDFTRKRLSVIVETCGEKLLVVKGAPEEIFSCSTSYCSKGEIIQFDDETRQRAWRVYRDLSSDGFRVLALATKKIDANKNVFAKEDESDLAICGFIGFLDPPKQGVKEAIQSLEDSGIEVKIITGDNELVAQKICAGIELPVKGILLGGDMDRLSDEALNRRVETTTIFARFSPEQKNRIILALKANHHVVGYMGDGINDAPSLKTADVGISVNNAVDVAKESADIILTKKNLGILVDGVVEGRKVFANTMKYIQMGLSSNFGNMFSAAGAVVFLPFFPMLPLQILLNNFIYDLSQVTIPIDNVDKEMTQGPRRWNMKFVKNYMITFGLISSLFDFLTFFVLFSVFKLQESAFQTGWFLESLATQILVIHIIRTRKIPFIESRPHILLLLSTVTMLIFSWMIPYTPIAAFFGLQPLPPLVLLAISGIVVMYLMVVEIGKRCFYRFNKI